MASYFVTLLTQILVIIQSAILTYAHKGGENLFSVIKPIRLISLKSSAPELGIINGDYFICSVYERRDNNVETKKRKEKYLAKILANFSIFLFKTMKR